MSHEPTDPQPPADGHAAKRNARRISLMTIGFWVIAIAILILRATSAHVGVNDSLYFATAEMWLIGAGCVGAPVFALRVLGRHLSPACCMHISMLLAGGAIAYTALLPAIHPAPLTAMLVLLPLLAGAIQCANASDALGREQAAEARGIAGAREAFAIERAALEDQITELRATEAARIEQIAGLTAQLATARTESESAFEAGARALAAAVGPEIRAQSDEETGDTGQLPIAEAWPLHRPDARALPRTGSHPLHVVPSQEMHREAHLGRTNGHRTDGIGG